MAYIYDLADTWNASGTTFTGIKLNVTDTASAAASLLMDLQVGGVSKFRVDKSGFIRVDGGSVSDAAIKIGNPNTGFFGISTAAFGVTAGNVEVARFQDNGQLRLPSSISLTWNSDTFLTRDAANTLAQRNGVNAQAFNLYNTYTDASNYERGFMRFSSNVLEIGTQAAGTGTLRTIALRGNIIALGRASSGAYDISLVPVASNILNICQPGGGAPLQQISAEGIKQRATYQFAWCVGNDASVAPDTGVARSAAGVAKITDGSTGTGQLIFIVPTTNPGITGALWNNSGTLAIS